MPSNAAAEGAASGLAAAPRGSVEPVSSVVAAVERVTFAVTFVLAATKRVALAPSAIKRSSVECVT